jgi:Cu/Ag efflux pump CusA
MLSKIIETCARNRFIVFTAFLMLTLAGIWSLQHVPLDALPDISDIQVVVHTNWMGQPPDVIEDQVTYPIVTSLLAAPHVKAVRAQTMLGDSYVYVVFQDGTDLYWARSRIITSNRSAGAFPQMCIQLLARMQPARAGFMNTPSWIKAVSTTWQTCEACKTGGCATRWRPFRVLPR